ncbi:Basement membrane proteoglycan [Toxocara canis]|uniref:Basement membrane proteoglycan n=1 Tax=Toxocara canis TaxID=6265 RepID=A0A0B2VFG7_TOXCA|nr:Basement membrane proteoglycan [Toxocara canis]
MVRTTAAHVFESMLGLSGLCNSDVHTELGSCSGNGLPNANAQRVKDAQPMIRAVGQEAHLTCPAEGARGVLGEAKWEKVGGELPYAYSVRNGVLVLKDLARSDGGVYKCTLQTESGMATVTHINLQVSGGPFQ